MPIPDPAAVGRKFYALTGQIWAMPPSGINGGVNPLWEMDGTRKGSLPRK